MYHLNFSEMILLLSALSWFFLCLETLLRPEDYTIEDKSLVLAKLNQ